MEPESFSFAWSFFKMLAALAVVIALMIGAMLIVKKYFYQSPGISAANSMIDIIATRHLGPKSSFMLIEVLGQPLLVGISPQGMSLLAAINDPAALDRLNSLRKAGRTSPAPPGSLLNGAASLWKTIGIRRKDG